MGTIARGGGAKVSMIEAQKLYKIKSPSGKVLNIFATTIFHAIDKALWNESYKHQRKQYFDLNKFYKR